MIGTKKLWAGAFFCLLVAWMGVIYSFSAQEAPRSSNVSQGVCYRLVNRVNDIFGMELEEDEKLDVAGKIEFPIRKAAHMTEYAILGCLFVGTMLAWNRAWKIKLLLSQMGVFVYASTDEFHQTFVAGRDGSIRDVLIDSAGCLIGLLILTGIRAVCNRIKR